jgi:hypothetical protein
MPPSFLRPILGQNVDGYFRPEFAVIDNPSVQPEISRGRLLWRLFRDEFPPNFMAVAVVMSRRYDLAEAIFLD